MNQLGPVTIAKLNKYLVLNKDLYIFNFRSLISLTIVLVETKNLDNISEINNVKKLEFIIPKKEEKTTKNIFLLAFAFIDQLDPPSRIFEYMAKS